MMNFDLIYAMIYSMPLPLFKSGPVALLLVLFSLQTTSAAAQPVLDPDNGFAPPWQKTLLIVGQDKPTIEAYVKATKIVPGGMMEYTSIQTLSGLSLPFSNGAGLHHAGYLMQKYPNSILQLGLYMVDALLQVNDGTYDENIDKLADWLAALDRPVFLRIGYEFDEPTNNYDTTQYKFAFQRIVKRFRAKGVTNVAFVWHSAAKMTDKDPMMWYPGDEYVDWFGISYFSPSQYETAMSFYWQAYLKGKNFMIAEASPFGMYTLRAKQDWYNKFFQFIEETKPQAVSYINSHWDAMRTYKNSRYGDARVQKFPEILDMWMKEINKDKYLNAEDLVGDLQE